MIEDVGMKTADLQKNAAQRKQLEDKLAVEQREIEKRQNEIRHKGSELKSLKTELEKKDEQLKKYKKFTNFLQSVVNDKSGESFNDITDL